MPIVYLENYPYYFREIPFPKAYLKQPDGDFLVLLKADVIYDFLLDIGYSPEEAAYFFSKDDFRTCIEDDGLI